MKTVQRQPIWKRFLSYFYSFKIEHTSSEHNPSLDVYLKQGRYQLCTENAVYSYGDLYDNFTKTFDHLNLDELDVKKVLVLGFGMGSIPVILERLFEKKYDYTGVEIDCKVLELATKYVVPNIKSTMKLCCEDAMKFVSDCKEKFDLVAMDIFLDDVIPSSFEQTEFLLKLSSLLSSEGVLLYNRLSLTKKDLTDTQFFYSNNFSTVFPQATYLDVEGNWMLINRKDVLR